MYVLLLKFVIKDNKDLYNNNIIVNLDINICYNLIVSPRLSYRYKIYRPNKHTHILYYSIVEILSLLSYFFFYILLISCSFLSLYTCIYSCNYMISV